MHRHGIAAGIAMVIACLADLAAGDGCMIAPARHSERIVTSPRQEAVLVHDGNTVTVCLRTHFRAGPEEVAWIVPVPAKPDRIEKAEHEVFDFLDREYAPRFHFPAAPKGGGFGCGCGGMAALQDGGGVSRSVVVEASGTAGVFQYVVLAATHAADLEKWLADNGFSAPVGAARLFERYVREGWHWLAMRIRPEEKGKRDLVPHPIIYTYRATEVTYPLAISRLSADLDNEIVLYVVAATRYACANWANGTSRELVGTPSRLAADADSPSGTNYERLFRQAAEGKQGPVFITEYAGEAVAPHGLLERVTNHRPPNGPVGTSQLTRLRALMPAKAMTADVRLVPAPAWEPVSNHFHLPVRPAGEAARAAVPAGVFLLLGAGATLRRRHGWIRAAGLLLILVACLAAAMV